MSKQANWIQRCLRRGEVPIVSLGYVTYNIPVYTLPPATFGTTFKGGSNE